MRAHFDSTTHGEVTVTAMFDTAWCIESAVDNFGNDVDLDRADEWRAEEALEEAVRREMAA